MTVAKRKKKENNYFKNLSHLKKMLEKSAESAKNPLERDKKERPNRKSVIFENISKNIN